ncbi:hypothetical protein FACS189431_3400 [Alphaproteobacteria bacterium]|nr:hypothetical protein FACS189431_3400 [Alphaproteobacteria bacterium]
MSPNLKLHKPIVAKSEKAPHTIILQKVSYFVIILLMNVGQDSMLGYRKYHLWFRTAIRTIYKQ